MEDEKIRIKYFQSHQSGFTMLGKHAEEAETQHSALSTVMRLLHRIVGDDTPSGVDWAEGNFSLSCFNRVRSFICQRFRGMTASEKMEWLMALRRELQSPSSSHQLRDLLSQLDAIIVLTEDAAKNETVMFAMDLSQMVSEWVYNASVIGAAVQTQPRDAGASRLSPAANVELTCSTVNAIAPQVRRQLTDAILHPPSVVDKSDVLTLAPSLLFSIMRDRVVISREECFEAFAKGFNGESPLEDLCSAFAFGMHQLCYCGLVNEKHGSKNNVHVLYERTALVWCSGN
jgi:hypothetical protein